MYSTKTAITVNLQELLSKLDDYDIYTYCIGNFKVGKLMNSPLRSDDNIPSFAIFRNKEGALMFKDHGTGESGNAITFLKLYKNITDRNSLEQELLKINNGINISNSVKNTYKHTTNYETDIGIVRQPFTFIDKQYWSQFHISIDTLKKFNVFSIKYYLSNGIVKGIYKNDNPMYAYKVYGKFKIYRPLASKYIKWRNNLTYDCVQGLKELPEFGNILIITKSLKDVMCLYEMGINAIAASSETTFIPTYLLENLKTKWKKIYLLYDRDKAGVKKARELSKEHNLNAFFVHKKFKSKDISDAIKNNSFDEVKEWINTIINGRIQDT